MKEKTIDNSLFKAIFESAIEGILVVALDGSIQRANTAGESIFGYSHGELNGRKVESLIPEKFRENHTSYRTEYAQNPKERSMGRDLDLWGLRKDGSQFPLKISLSPIDINGQQAVVAFVMDISEQRKTELISYESDRKLSTLIGNLQGIVFRCQNDRDWTMEYISAGCQNITAYSPQEFLEGKVCFGNVIHPDDRDRVWNDIQNAIADKRPFDLAYRIRDKKGNIKYVRETGLGIFDKNGSLEALEGFIADITELKSTGEELSRKEAKNKALLEALPDMMIIQDYDGNYLDLYVPEPENLHFSKTGIIGENMEDILPADVLSTYKMVFKKVRETKKPQLLEYIMDGKDGPKMYEGRTVPLNPHALLTIVRDITDRKRMEESLFIKNRALESAGNSILIADAKLPGRPIIYANSAFYKMSGYNRDEVTGRNCRFLQNDDRDQEAIGTMADAIQKGEPCQVELRNYKKDGSMFWNELTITPVHNDQGGLTHFIGVQNDITERKREELLKDSVRRILEQIANKEPLMDISTRIIETVEEHFKGSLASLLLLDREQGTLHKLAAPNLPEGFSKGIEGAKIGENVGSSGTAAFLRKVVVVSDISVDPRWEDYWELASEHGLQSCWSFPIMSSEKEVLGTFAMYFDHRREPKKNEREMAAEITYLASVAIERHRINEKLEQNTQQLKEYSQNLEEKVRARTDELQVMVQKLVETNLSLEDQILETKSAEGRALESHAMFTAISKNFPNGVIVVFNTNFEIVYMDGGEMQYYGFEKGRFEGMRIDDIGTLPRKYKTRIKGNIKKTMEGAHLTFEAPFKDRTYSVGTSPLLGDNGKVKWMLFVYTDITEQKEAEANMRKALIKEQELNELKSRFISMASHEFRTPLSAISTSAILIAKQNMPGKEEKREKYVNQIQSNVRNLVDILNDFLSLSKLEEGKVRAKPEQFNLVEFTENLIQGMKPNRKRDQKINLRSNREAIPIYLDPKLMRHVLINLLSNAIKYSEEGTEILLSLEYSDDLVSVAVTDQGIGIPIEEQANLFDRFFRAENSTNIQGTGLGLHIVKQYTELMGGTVRFKSEMGKGATFIVEFPNP